jgi:hypothetical protein
VVTPHAAADDDEPVRLLTPHSTLEEIEAFTAAMRAAGAQDNSVVFADIKPSGIRRHYGMITRLGGYPHTTHTREDP